MGSCKFSKFTFLLFISILFAATGESSDHEAAMLSFKSGIVSDPLRVLENWNPRDFYFCNWSGIKCNKARDRVVLMDLSGKSLRGTISPSLANLSSLQILDLSRNMFEGEIPVELGSLFRLKQLSLSWNLLRGKIPARLGLLQSLVYLDLGSNRLDGEIPFPLFCNRSSSLEYVDLSNNTLSGKIPVTDDCPLSSLRFMLLWSNNLHGDVPPSLSNSSNLEWLDLESNILTGELPSGVVSKMPKLQFLYLSYNGFVSHDSNTNLTPFFASLVNSSNIQELELAGNNLSGQIPSIIGDVSPNFVELHLDDNLLNGPIPLQISKLVNLTLLNLSSNFLNGTIPSELSRMERLERVLLSNNSLSGEIPSALENLLHLGLLDLSNNKLSGPIPDTLANLSQLRRLLLYHNQLTGTIPSNLGGCVNLEILDLSYNELAGVIPVEVAKLSSLKLYLNLSHNHLHGPLPLELSKMDMVLAMDLSSNNLSGTIPPQLGSCIALEHLNLSGNCLQGQLPALVGQLPYLKQLDVAFNNLSGEIPGAFQASTMLKEMNFSFNSFSGNISNKGSFSSLTINSFMGNKGLCGSIKGMSNCRKKRAHHSVILAIILSVIIVSLFLMFWHSLALRSLLRSQAIFSGGDFEEEEEEEEEDEELKYPTVSYKQLSEATSGFCSSSLIGSGSFGHVYKGILDNTRIAVKVLDPKTAEKLSGSFKRECQVVRRTRHRNLIRIITICSKPDFKALVLPLMPNGSLERHLYPADCSSPGLDLIQLVSICSDVAEGMAYLHHHSPVKVVHCDLKPSNILLDYDMTALVADFGIARLVNYGQEETISAHESLSFSSTDDLLCGSVGYIAPEYGMGKRASTEGDVYSFGVLLLEIVSGKQPTDVLFDKGASLVEWVKSHFPHRLKPIVEQALQRYTPAAMAAYNDKLWNDTILELIELGLLCTQHNPSTRPTMLDIAHELGQLKQFVSNPSSTLHEEAPTKPDAV